MTDKELYEMEALLEDMTEDYILSKMPSKLQDKNNPEKYYKFWYTESIVWYDWLRETTRQKDLKWQTIELCMRLAERWYINLETFYNNGYSR